VDPGSPLRPLFAEMPGVARLVDTDDAPGAPDAVVALMSLPLAFGTDLSNIPADVPYLRVPAERQARWRQRLGPGDGRKRVGVVWWGNPAFANDRERSIPWARFAPLLARRNVSFHVLAHELRPAEAAEVGALATVHEGIGDFADTAALVEAMDLVISVDTAVAHLAGALARPVWILLPFGPDWRWMLAREDSPWYPTARLFRQPARGDWDSVMQRVRETLDATLG
jgi:ADP-heptose:LPS heptosyltransferase